MTVETGGDVTVDTFRRTAYRPILDGEPMNTSPYVVLDLSALPDDVEFDEGAAIPNTGFLIVEDGPLAARWVRDRPPELPDGIENGLWWGRTIVRWERFDDEWLDETAVEGTPELGPLLDRIGERIPDNGDKIGGWPFFDGLVDGAWLQLSAGALTAGEGEFTSFGTGWALVGSPTAGGTVPIASESHW